MNSIETQWRTLFPIGVGHCLTTTGQRACYARLVLIREHIERRMLAVFRPPALSGVEGSSSVKLGTVLR
jgi:hypothetical protein